MSIFGKSEPETVEVNGKSLRCVVCGNDTFHSREAQLHGAVATFFDIEWTSPTATCYVCADCSYIHWFL
jgi:predicted nucleic-acid-binding Zn-ribbon protein